MIGTIRKLAPARVACFCLMATSLAGHAAPRSERMLRAQPGESRAPGRTVRPAAVPAAPSDTSWREHFSFLSAGGRFWLTSNAGYRTEQNGEPPAYGMRYWPGFGGTTLHGCLWGAKPRQDPVVFWRFFTVWHPAQNALLVQQSGATGVVGIGYEDPATGVAEQTFTAPDGTRWDVRHIRNRVSPDSLVTRSLQRTTGDWEPRRTYTWIRQRPGPGAPCGPTQEMNDGDPERAGTGDDREPGGPNREITR